MGWSQRVRLLLDGQFEQAGLGRPRMYPWDRVHVARRALANTGFVFGQDPRVLAARLGIKVLYGSACHCGGEIVGAGGILVRGGLDRRTRGLMTFHGLAHELLTRERWEHSHADAWLLTGDLAIPRGSPLLNVTDTLRRAHAPPSFVERWAAMSARLGSVASEEAA